MSGTKKIVAAKIDTKVAEGHKATARQVAQLQRQIQEISAGSPAIKPAANASTTGSRRRAADRRVVDHP